MKLPAIFATLVLDVLLTLQPGAAKAQVELPYNLTEGSYTGSFVRSPANSESPQRGEVRLELNRNGRIFGAFVAPNAPAEFIYFRGQIDPATRQGFLRMLRSDTPGGVFYAVPGSEKLAVFLYPDGRLIGGALDAQGTATALRANFYATTPLPGVPAP